MAQVLLYSRPSWQQRRAESCRRKHCRGSACAPYPMLSVSFLYLLYVAIRLRCGGAHDIELLQPVDVSSCEQGRTPVDAWLGCGRVPGALAVFYWLYWVIS